MELVEFDGIGDSMLARLPPDSGFRNVAKRGKRRILDSVKTRNSGTAGFWILRGR
jgi:hypothetical protein